MIGGYLKFHSINEKNKNLLSYPICKQTCLNKDKLKPKNKFYLRKKEENSFPIVEITDRMVITFFLKIISENIRFIDK